MKHASQMQKIAVLQVSDIKYKTRTLSITLIWYGLLFASCSAVIQYKRPIRRQTSQQPIQHVRIIATVTVVWIMWVCTVKLSVGSQVTMQVHSFWMVTGVRRISGKISKSWVLLYQLQFVYNKSHKTCPEI
jgi:hypothetical protein